MARPRKDKERVLLERARDLQALIEHFAVTRVVQNSTFNIGGTFSIGQFRDEWCFISSWKRKNYAKKNVTFRSYKAVSEKFNDLLGIRAELVRDVVGYINHKRIDLNDLLARIPYKVRVIKSGTRTHYDKKTKSRKLCRSWTRKFLPESRQVWDRMLNDPRYATMETAPNMTPRVNRLLKMYESLDALAVKFNGLDTTIQEVKAKLKQHKFPIWLVEILEKNLSLPLQRSSNVV